MTELWNVVEQHRGQIVSLLRQLVQTNTVNPYSGDAAPGGEAAGQEVLAPLFRAMGAHVALFDCPDDVYGRTGVLGPADRDFSGRPNLVATFDFSGEGPTIVINGHMDTVGIESMAAGALDARLDGGRIWGRGASDCKGGLTVGLSAIRALLECGTPLRGRIVFQSVVDEECNGSGAGTLACFDAGHTGDIALFMDGNGDALTMGCNGCLTADVHVTGQEGHAALGTGVSAIEKALVVKRGLDAFKAARETEHPDCRVNLGILRSGSHPAVVPGAAYMSLNTVYAADEAVDCRERTGSYGGREVRESFERAIAEAQSGDTWLTDHPSQITWVKDLIPYVQDTADPWIAGFVAAYEVAVGRPPAYDRMVAWSDAAHSAALFGVPTVLYGPGVEGVAHSSGEYVEVEDLIDCTRVVATYLWQQLARP